MPEMGGLEAARAIREREAATGRHVPIIAVTAHAMQGDRQRCLDAGMDGYLSKPIDIDDLVQTVEQFGGVSAHTAASDRSRRSERLLTPSSTSGLHWSRGWRSTTARRDSRAVSRDVFRTCVVSSRALKRQDGEVASDGAHALKGSLATGGSKRGREIAAALERMGARADSRAPTSHQARSII